jgi:hypothetical protein
VLVSRKWMVSRVEVKLRPKIIMGTNAGTKGAFCPINGIRCSFIMDFLR